MNGRVRQRLGVSGRGQGVGYRYFTQREAHTLGLGGFVKNLPNGNVQLEAEGTAEKLLALAAALRQGPSLSRVDGIQVSDVPPQNDPEERFIITG